MQGNGTVSDENIQAWLNARAAQIEQEFAAQAAAAKATAAAAAKNAQNPQNGIQLAKPDSSALVADPNSADDSEQISAADLAQFAALLQASLADSAIR